jgi:hypothetical protein
VNVRRDAGELTLAYEALRAQATGELPATTPRGLALFLAEGLPTWMQAWTPVASTPTTARPTAREHPPPTGVGGEVVKLLAEMALRCQRRWATG